MPAKVSTRASDYREIDRFEGELATTDYELLDVTVQKGWQEFALCDGETLVVSESVGTAPHFLTGEERLRVITLLRPLPPWGHLSDLLPTGCSSVTVRESSTTQPPHCRMRWRTRVDGFRALIENGELQLRTLAAVLRT